MHDAPDVVFAQRTADARQVGDITLDQRAVAHGLTVTGNDFSYNSGLGVGLYRSSGNTIVRNRIDFDVRFNGSTYAAESRTFKEGLLRALTIHYEGRNRAWGGFTAQGAQPSAGSLSLVVGVLVDDAIVEIENIMRHLEMGKTPYQAAMELLYEGAALAVLVVFVMILLRV